MASFRSNKKANHDGGLDRISHLPDSILSCILSLLPIKDAVSSSILSTRWRRLTVSVFNLDVDLLLFKRYEQFKSFTNYMDKALSSESTEGRISIERFRLDHIDVLPTIDSFRIVCGWISAAIGHGVKVLDLSSHSYSETRSVTTPTSVLFFSKTLVRLTLDIPSLLITVPIHVSLPSLETLDLRFIKFQDDGSVKRLFSSCPKLEELSIINPGVRNIRCLEISNPSLKCLTLVFNGSDAHRFTVAVDLPNLVYFKYTDSRAETFSIVNMPSLVRADIDIIHKPHAKVKLFKGIGNVKSFDLLIYPEALPFLSGRRYAAFQNLVKLEIELDNDWDGTGLFEFLEISPNLQTLVIYQLPNEVSFPMEKVPSCVSYRLKQFIVYNFLDESCFFEMVTYILNNATVIEKVVIYMDTMQEWHDCEPFNVEDKYRMMKQLLSIPRSSNKCQVVVK